MPRRQVAMSLSPEAHALLGRLVATGLYGTTVSECARAILMSVLRDNAIRYRGAWTQP